MLSYAYLNRLASFREFLNILHRNHSVLQRGQAHKQTDSMASSLPPSSSPPASSPTSSPARAVLLDPYSGNARASGWKAPNFAKRERSPESLNSSPAHKRVKRTDPFEPSSPFGMRHLPASSSPFGSPPRYVPAVPRSPYKQTLYAKQVTLWSDRISDIFNHDHETRLDLRYVCTRSCLTNCQQTAVIST